MLNENWLFLSCLRSAPEILNYEPITTATDLWWVHSCKTCSDFMLDDVQQLFKHSLSNRFSNIKASDDQTAGFQTRLFNQMICKWEWRWSISVSSHKPQSSSAKLMAVYSLGNYFNGHLCSHFCGRPNNERRTNVVFIEDVNSVNSRALLYMLWLCPACLCVSLRSVGVIAYMLVTGESPFAGDDKQETFLNVSQVSVDYSREAFSRVSELAVDFIRKLLVKAPEWVKAVCELTSNPPHRIDTVRWFIVNGITGLLAWSYKQKDERWFPQDNPTVT